MSIGTNGHLGKRAVWCEWANKQMVARGVGKCVEVWGTGKGAGMCVEVWGQVRKSVSKGV